MLYRRGGAGSAEITRLVVSSAPVRDEADRVVAAVTVFADVERQRRAEEALRASETRLAEERARLAALVDHLPVGVCFVGQDGTPVLSNPSRMRDGEEQWLAWDESGARLPRERYPGARALRGEAVPGVEFLHRASDGAETWTRVSGVPLLDAEGEVAAALVVIADIDAQKRAQEALQRLNETLEARVAERTAERDRMWRHSTDLMLVARFDGTIVAVNPAWTVLLGWQEDDLIGHSFMELVHPDDAAATLAEAGRSAEGATTPRFENRYRHKSGGHRWLSWTAVPEAGLIHAVARDVTVEKEQAETLAQAEAVLRQSQKMEAVGQLTGGLAHDFNNLLVGISGSLELMQARVAQGRVNDLERYLVAAQGAAKRAAALTHRLLAFSRRQTLAPRPTDVNRLVAGMQELIERTTGPEVSDGGAGRRRGPVDHAGGPAPVGERAAEPVHQRTRRHARRRPDHHGDRQPLAGRARGGRAGHAAGAVRVPVRVRQRHRHGAGRDRPRLRPVLHHQAHRPGNGPGPVHGVRLRPAVGRPGPHLLGGWAGHDGLPLPAPPCRRGGRP